ncbi:DUF6167 family protein [Nocardioides sp. AE5]|uniref:DUF6167 family protein n=1 Tax=Nocardioides sp. AE5 TaxID=2962573 RepID=UPI0028823E1D|nr:DUF6167 family protein [Nocardioides sp. AE5]MDT0201474.1 DUF6167 family protein [Nocardioides sp. AE5]
MRGAFWFVAGAGVSIYAMNKARQVRDTFTLDGLQDRANALALGARMLGQEVAQGRAEKEVELRERLGLVPAGTPELAAAGRHRATTPELTTPHQEGNN